MKVTERIAAAFGYTPMVRELSTDWVSFADAANLGNVDLSGLWNYAEGIRATRSRAMQVATVAAGRNTIAGTSGRLPLFAYKGGIKLVDQPSLLQQPQRGIPRATTMTNLYDELIFYPCTWWHVTERDFYGWPRFITPASNSIAKIDSFGNLLGYTAGGEYIETKPQDVIRFDSPLASGLLQDASRTIRRAIAIEDAAALAEDNPVPTVELHNEDATPLTEKEKEDLLDGWSAARRRRGVAYTSKGIKAIAHGVQNSQLLIEGRRALSLDLVRHLNMPAWAASTAVEGGDMTYDNRSLRNWELIDLTLANYFTAVDGRLSMDDVTPHGWTVNVDYDALTTPDQKTRFETYAAGKSAGFIDNEWIAAQEGWESVPKGAQ